MKTLNCLFALCLMLGSTSIIAQSDSNSPFSLMAFGSIGYGIIDNDGAANYNLNSNSGELILNYRFGQKFGLATGIGLTELSGQGFNAEEVFYHERSLIKVPLLFTHDYAIVDKFRALFSIGVYGQTITRDNFTFQNRTEKDIYQGWTVGAQFGIGLFFETNESMSLGFQYTGLADFNTLESNKENLMNSKQRLDGLNSLGFVFLLHLN